ncbi:helix-turn-helix transcriptional regulator [uncultured Bacteroides sp.]|uniref:helix-turn-helix transcriptional regulator n=1 Tax=uncultured Bacteroides sp. TaxID=162156 RepID=UPI0026304376|nr:helix-turn-helix transcriptional regulator [uncultured Bacteroides sp.]
MENRIKEILSEKAMTAKDLATSVGISSVSLYNIINGKQEASANTLNTIASALGVPFWQLFISYNDIHSVTAPTITCPHCGQKIELEAKVVEKGGI